MRFQMRMLRPTLLLLACFILSAASSPSCSHIPVPIEIHDESLVLIKGDPLATVTYPNYAVEMNFLTSGQNDMNKLQLDAWISANVPSGGTVLMKAKAWMDFNTEIGKLCSETPCDFGLQQKLNAIVSKINSAMVTQ